MAQAALRELFSSEARFSLASNRPIRHSESIEAIALRTAGIVRQGIKTMTQSVIETVTLGRADLAVTMLDKAARDALELLRIGARVARRAVAYCNGEGRNRQWINGRSHPAWDQEDSDRRDRADERALAKASEIAARYGATVKIGGDPRGCVFKLFPASGRSNGFTGEGWGVA